MSHEPQTRGAKRPLPPYDHPAVSAALFSPNPGATLPKTSQERGVDVPLPGGRIAGGLFCARLPQAPVLFVLQGGHETITDTISLWPDWAAGAGANLFQIDYPGTGASPGRACLSACREAVRASLRWLSERPGDEVPGIVVLGRGIGATLAVDAVTALSESRVRGLILESPIADLDEVLGARVDWARGAPPRQAVRQAIGRDWDMRAQLTRWQGPLLVLQANLAPPFPFSHGELIAQWGGGELTILDRGDRDDVPRLNEAEYRPALEAFVHTHAILEDDVQPPTSRFSRSDQ